MTPMSHTIFTYITLMIVFGGMTGNAGQARAPDGRIALKINSTIPPGGSAGVAWGNGTLTLNDGSTRPFTIRGIRIEGQQGREFALEAKGEVYKLTKVDALTGTYKRASGELSPERQTNTLMIENQHGVFVVVTVTFEGKHHEVRLTPSETGVTVQLD
jgi:hypothetical protein